MENFDKFLFSETFKLLSISVLRILCACVRFSLVVCVPWQGKSKMISVLSIVHDTMVDGPGFRTSIYCAGCPNHCPGCHNPQSWDISHGTMTSTDELMKEIMSDPFANVTFSGGDPMFQAKGFAELARAIREQSSKSIWCFTGYLFENLVKNPEQLELLRQIDVLVDGPFVQALRDEDLFFRGSSNQRIINVQKSLKEGRVIELNLTTENPNPVL